MYKYAKVIVVFNHNKEDQYKQIKITFMIIGF